MQIRPLSPHGQKHTKMKPAQECQDVCNTMNSYEVLEITLYISDVCWVDESIGFGKGNNEPPP